MCVELVDVHRVTLAYCAMLGQISPGQMDRHGQSIAGGSMANVQTVSERSESYRGDVHVLKNDAVRRNQRQIIDSFGQRSIQFGIVLLEVTFQDDHYSSIIDFLAILGQIQ